MLSGTVLFGNRRDHGSWRTGIDRDNRPIVDVDSTVVHRNRQPGKKGKFNNYY